MTGLSAGVIKQVLDNGLTVLVKERHSAPVVAIYTYVKAGYLNEPDDLVGISHLMEHMFFKGTPKRGPGEIARETKALGGYLNASTIYDHTLYYTVLPAQNFARGLEIQADALMHPVFDPVELQRETEVIIQEARRKLDTPAAVAREKLLALAFDHHRIRRWRIGTETGLRSFRRQDLFTFHRNLYRPENIILVILGDVSAEEVFAQVERHYAGFPGGTLVKHASPPEPPQSGFKYRLLRGDLQRCHLAIGFHTPPVLHDDTFALEVLAFALGQGRSSRLVRRVKEERELLNLVSAYDYTLPDVGFFVIEGIGEAEKVRAAEAVIFGELAAVQKRGVREEELRKARNVLESTYLFSMASMSGQAGVLARYEALGDFHLAETYLERLAVVTAADVARVARNYLKVPNCSVLEYVPQRADLQPARVETLEADLGRLLRAGSGGELATASQHLGEMEISVRPSDVRDARVQRFSFANGVTLLVKENHHLPITSLGIFARGGRCDENLALAGVTDLMLRTALKGTRQRSAAEIAQQIEMCGAGLHVSADPDYASFATNFASRHLEQVWEILCDVVLNPTFPPEEVEKERRDALARIARLKDDMFAYPLQLLFAALFEGHPYGLPQMGTRESVAALSRKDLEDWHGALIRPRRLTVVVVGDVEGTQLCDLVASEFGQLDSHQTEPRVFPAVAAPQRKQVRWETREKEQTALALGFPGPAFLDEEVYPLTVLQNIISGLGGRFFEELRSRRSLAYTVRSFLVSRRQGGAFVSYIATSPEKENAAREGLRREFRRLQQEPVTGDELRRAIDYTTGMFQIGLETNRAQMSRLAHYELLDKDLEELDKYVSKISQVTREEIFETAQKYFDLERYAEGGVRAVRL